MVDGNVVVSVDIFRMFLGEFLAASRESDFLNVEDSVPDDAVDVESLKFFLNLSLKKQLYAYVLADIVVKDVYRRLDGVFEPSWDDIFYVWAGVVFDNVVDFAGNVLFLEAEARGTNVMFPELSVEDREFMAEQDRMEGLEGFDDYDVEGFLRPEVLGDLDTVLKQAGFEVMKNDITVGMSSVSVAVRDVGLAIVMTMSSLEDMGNPNVTVDNFLNFS